MQALNINKTKVMKQFHGRLEEKYECVHVCVWREYKFSYSKVGSQ